MMQIFKKENIIRSFQVENGKVYTTIELNGFNVTNPTVQQFKSIGWEEYTPGPSPEPEPYVPTLEELVESKIREKYSINQEFEVNRKKETEPDAFQVYYDYVEECIREAKEEQPHRDRNTD
jgi:hypothetical protein